MKPWHLFLAHAVISAALAIGIVSEYFDSIKKIKLRRCLIILTLIIAFPYVILFSSIGTFFDSRLRAYLSDDFVYDIKMWWNNLLYDFDITKISGWEKQDQPTVSESQTQKTEP